MGSWGREEILPPPDIKTIYVCFLFVIVLKCIIHYVWLTLLKIKRLPRTICTLGLLFDAAPAASACCLAACLPLFCLISQHGETRMLPLIRFKTLKCHKLSLLVLPDIHHFCSTTTTSKRADHKVVPTSLHSVLLYSQDKDSHFSLWRLCNTAIIGQIIVRWSQKLVS